MPLGLKLFTVASIPVVPNAAIGIGAQLATNKPSRQIAGVMGRKIMSPLGRFNPLGKKKI